MCDQVETENKPIPVEYAVIGAGPAGICAVAKLYGSNIPGDKIVWIDPQFKVGDFGTKLSVGSSVPGNTTVASYQKVNHAIYTMIPACAPTEKEKNKFAMTALAPDITCSLKIAAEPLQHITENLQKLVHVVKGNVSTISETNKGLQLDIKVTNDTIKCILAKRVILAVGAKPKTISLPDHITIIDSNVTFIESKLRQYLNENPGITKVAVIGSSHSAALATMYLLEAGIVVKQFMNKEYKFAIPAIASDGTAYMQFDNTGLKGKVAMFIRQLLTDNKMSNMWECNVSKNVDAFLAAQLSECTHAVICIGYTLSSSLQINGEPLKAFKYDRYSTRMLHADGRFIPGMFGIGIAFPPEITTISGEIEYAVGVEKFWNSINDKILTAWQNYPAEII